MARVTKVEHAQKDYPEHGIKKGDTYWWWKHRNGPKQFSKAPPRPSQTAGSPFLSQAYGFGESLEAVLDLDDAKAVVEEVKSDAESLRDEVEGNLQNMPDSLQQGPTGELLQGRVDSLQEMIDELDSLDLDVERDEGETDDEWEARLEGVLDEVRGIAYNGE